LRGYLANTERVRIQGVEIETTAKIGKRIKLHGNAAWTDAQYVSFVDAPCPLELTGGPAACDVSGTELPGVSRWSASFGGELSQPVDTGPFHGEAYLGAEASRRSSFSSNASSSEFLRVDGYTVMNLRGGFRSDSGWEIFVWARNAFDTEYFEFLSPQPGNSGLVGGQLGDPRTFGVTLKAEF